MPCDSDIEPETPECRPTLPTAAIVAGMETESTLATSSSSRSSRVESDSESDQSAVVSLLQRLRSPTPSDLARKRIVTTNPPIGAKRGKVGHASTGLKVLSALIELSPILVRVLPCRIKSYSVRHAVKKSH